MSQQFPTVCVELPAWVGPYTARVSRAHFQTLEGRMRFVMGLARENIKAGTGGPFGAAIFNAETHELIAPGMNLVTSSQCSVLHAEIVAIMIAQKKSGSFNLGANGMPPAELVTSIVPCAMCLGAIPWAGIRKLVCGGRDQDARDIGFNEGAKVDDWIGALAKRNIETITDICREEAIDILKSYAALGGMIYNSDTE